MTASWQLFLCASLSMGVIALSYLLLLPLLGKRYRAASLYAVWLVLALGFLVPFRPLPMAPAVQAQLPPRFSLPMAPTIVALTVQQKTESVTTGSALTPGLSSAPVAGASSGLSLWQGMAILWLVGAGLVLGFAICRHARFVRTVRRWQKPMENPAYLQGFVKAKERLNLKANIRLMLCPSVGSPMLTGLFHPVVLLPDEELTEEELSLVLAHELVHYRRGDLWVKAGLLLVTALHWFNPAAWLMARSLAFYQETSCDEAVTARASLADKRFYSETIIRVIRRQTRFSTSFSTSFYGGKQGMKRRILSIMSTGKRLGILICVGALVLTLSTGIAFGIDATVAPEGVDNSAFAVGDTVYIADPEAAGTRLLTAPTANDWAVPMGVYLNGTPATVLEISPSAGSTLPEWNLAHFGQNWYRVAIGGDGIQNGFQGWVPVCFLSGAAPADAPPSGIISITGGTGHVNLLQGFSADSTSLDMVQTGTEVRVLGQVQNWMHIQLGGKTGFVPVDAVALEESAQGLEAILPDRFDSLSYLEWGKLLTYARLMEEKVELYGTSLVEHWPLEGKAWFSQMADTYGGGFDDMRCLLPEDGDLQLDKALELAWDAFVNATGIDPAARNQYDFYPTFFTRYTDDPSVKHWKINITPKGIFEPSFEVELTNPGGEATLVTDLSDYLPEAMQLPEKRDFWEALAQWQAEKGSEVFWSLEDKAAFAAAYPSADWDDRLPDPKALKQEDAGRLAREALLSRYPVPPETVDSWTLNYSYWERPGGAYVWVVSFLDEAGVWQTQVEMDAFTGEILDAVNPYDAGNG